MDVYMILYICFLQGLLVSALEKTCTDSKCLGERDGDFYTKAGRGDDLETGHDGRKKRETENAYRVQFYVRISESVTKLFQKERILKNIEEYLHKDVNVNSQDVFNLTMDHDQITSEIDAHHVSFVLQPKTESIDVIIQTLENLVEMGTIIKMFGFPVHMHPEYFEKKEILWDGIKTVLRFETMMDYGLLEDKGILDGENHIATFLHEQFQISLRDIYDMALMRTKEDNTAVEFSIPPIMPLPRPTLLEHMELFFGGPCKDTCKQSGGTNTMDDCKSCGYVSVFGTNVYTKKQSFQSRTETWTGHERRFTIMAETEGKACPDHQEICTKGQSGLKCVGIGRCDPNFYKTVNVSIEVHGSIRLLDVYGLDVAIAAIEDSMADLHGFCRSAIHAKLFDHGRTKTGLLVWVQPSLGRKVSMEKFLDMIQNNDDIAVDNLIVSKVENSLSVTYSEPHKPIPRYIDNDCFGCASIEVWCILPDISLCLSKFECLDQQALAMKFAPDTEIVRVSILMSSETEFVDVTDEFKDVMKQQIADQLYCSAELLRNVNMVTAEDELLELGFEIILRDNNAELKELVIHLQRITDRGEMYIKTTEASLTAVSNSLLYQQFISGYPKPKKDELVSSHLGNAVTGGSFFALLILVITLFIKAGRKLHTRRVYQTQGASVQKQKHAEKASYKRQQTFLERK
ncbi:uncharacterized protein LOC123540852 [Mercenaria mercenaria]|uniref:uncharacterized protein LOC123540852 n=1 Tax=Mercenaria mercenaria TaxID=6596 RepID=UPI00234EA2D4|nr:uncharacterized protein LOC123540852 [Mercenaria mercenaria]